MQRKWSYLSHIIIETFKTCNHTTEIRTLSTKTLDTFCKGKKMLYTYELYTYITYYILYVCVLTFK